MQNFIGFLIVYYFLKISKNFLRAHFIIYEKCPFKGQLSQADNAESSVPGELNIELLKHRTC